MITDGLGEHAFRAFYTVGELEDHANTGWDTLTDEERAAWNAAAAAAVREYDTILAGQADAKAEALLASPTWTEAQESAQRAEEERARSAVNPADQMAEAQRIMDAEAVSEPTPAE